VTDKFELKDIESNKSLEKSEQMFTKPKNYQSHGTNSVQSFTDYTEHARVPKFQPNQLMCCRILALTIACIILTILTGLINPIQIADAVSEILEKYND